MIVTQGVRRRSPPGLPLPPSLPNVSSLPMPPISTPSPRADVPPLLARLALLARQAGEQILQVYARGFEVRRKDDASPVTEADELAERTIVTALHAMTPGVPVVAEEAASRGELPAAATRFWLVDPLDGTREFVQRNGEFTVNIALVEDGAPRLGVVHAPALDLLFAGEVGRGAWMEEGGVHAPIACRAVPDQGLHVLASRSHDDRAALQRWIERWLEHRPGPRRVAAWHAAGSSLKFGLLAAGRADLYPRLSRTMEWDTAAGHAVLRAAGGEVTDLAGAPLRYGKPGYENPHFVARGRP